MTSDKFRPADHTAPRPGVGECDSQRGRRSIGQPCASTGTCATTVDDESSSMDLRAEVLANKWSFSVIKELLDGTKRYGELRRAMGISQKVLTETLRRLEDRGFIHRRVVSAKPLRVEYSLTELGESLRLVLCAIRQWESRQGARPQPSPAPTG